MRTTDDDVLVFHGALDVRRTSEVRELLYARLARGTGDVVLDLGDVDSLDLTTLKMLAVANRRAETMGRRVVLRHVGPGVRRMLHLSHLRRMIPVEPDLPTQPVEPPRAV